MMGKDLEKKVDDIDGRVEILANIVIEMAEDKKLLLKIIKEQQVDIAELSTCFTCIAHACSLKREEEDDDVFFTPKKEYVLTRSYVIPPGLIQSLGRSIKPCNFSYRFSMFTLLHSY